MFSFLTKLTLFCFCSLETNIASAFSQITTTQQHITYNVWLHFSPLVGGPPFLPLHVSVVLNKDDDPHLFRFDYLPQNARDTTVLRRLFFLNQVPGLVRYYGTPNINTTRFTWEGMLETSAIKLGTTSRDLDSIQKFCQSYQETNGSLHLIENNCATFAWNLLSFAQLQWKLKVPLS